MTCINTEGTLTESGRQMFLALKSGWVTAEEIMQQAGLPGYRVRGGLRDLVQGGFVAQKDDKYNLTEKGAALLK
jgi:predicted transcriptional regulator